MAGGGGDVEDDPPPLPHDVIVPRIVRHDNIAVLRRVPRGDEGRAAQRRADAAAGRGALLVHEANARQVVVRPLEVAILDDEVEEVVSVTAALIPAAIPCSSCRYSGSSFGREICLAASR